MGNPTKLNGQFATSSLSNSMHNLQRIADEDEAYLQIIYSGWSQGKGYGIWCIHYTPARLFQSLYAEDKNLKTAIEKIMEERHKENGKEKET